MGKAFINFESFEGGVQGSMEGNTGEILGMMGLILIKMSNGDKDNLKRLITALTEGACRSFSTVNDNTIDCNCCGDDKIKSIREMLKVDSVAGLEEAVKALAEETGTKDDPTFHRVQQTIELLKKFRSEFGDIAGKDKH